MRRGRRSWTSGQASHGLIVNGNNVTANGLFVEHFQQDQVMWNGFNGTVIMFQSEAPYEVPNQASWMKSPTQNGYPSFTVANSVTNFGVGPASNAGTKSIPSNVITYP